MMDLHGPIVVALTGLAAAAVLAADTYAPAPRTPPEPAVVVASGEPVGGSFVCGIGDASEDEVRLITARPAGGGASPAQVDLRRFTEGTVRVSDEVSVFPGAASGSSYGGSGDHDEQALTGTWAAWRGAPAALWREWHIEGHDDLPDATVAGPCAAPSSEQWVVPGMSTEGGDEARLRLSNPFPGSATVAVGFLTPEGAAEPLVLRNLTVPAGSVREIVVNETLPEQADLTAVVEVSSGRMSVEGVQISRSAIGDIDGASLLQAASDPAEEWTVPWVSDDDATSSWLWIANPGQRTAPVQLTLHTADGGQLPEGLAEVSVPPGEMRRVDLSGTFPEDVTVAAVTARSNGAPVVVSAGTKIAADDPGETGVAVQLGASSPDRSWVVSGNAAGGRTEQLHVVNPTGTEAVADVALFVGVASLQPAELQGLEVGAGSSIVIDLNEVLDDGSEWSAFVTTSTGEVVAGRVGRSTLEEPEASEDPDPDDADDADADDADADADDPDADDPDADDADADDADADDADAEDADADDADADDPDADADDADAEDADADDADDADAADDDADTDDAEAPESASGALRLVVVPGMPSSAWSADGAGLAAVPTDGLVRHLRTAIGIGAEPGLRSPESPVPGLEPEVDGEPEPEPPTDLEADPAPDPEVENAPEPEPPTDLDPEPDPDGDDP